MNQRKKKIVLVEDESVLGEMYAEKFRREGFDVVLVDEGGKAIEVIRAEKPDLVVLDILLPQMSGFSILQRMKEDESIREIPVVILSNLGDEEDRKRGKQLGALCYILKVDMTPDEVAEQIKMFVKK